jgi:hypothetical protein
MVERSMPPGLTSRMLISARRIARPMTAVARSLLPRALNVPAAPSSRRIGPFSTTNTAQPPVDAVAPCNRNSGCSIAAKAVTTAGKCIGRQPAMTALMASFSALIATPRTGSMPRSWSGAIIAHSRQACTASCVGGTIGRPSVQPLEW